MKNPEWLNFSDLMEHGTPLWIKLKEAPSEPFVCAYKLELNLCHEQKVKFNIHVDERYELFVNGKRLGRGSERGDHNYAFCEEYTVLLNTGKNVLVVRAWKLGDISPFAQMSIGCGFVLFSTMPEVNELLATGIAPWKVKLLKGYNFIYPHIACPTGANFLIDGKSFDWGFERGSGDNWEKAVIDSSYHTDKINLVMAPLPQMMELPVKPGCVRYIDTFCKDKSAQVLDKNNLRSEIPDWDQLLSGHRSLKIPPNSFRRIIIDLKNYYCAYTELIVSGGHDCEIKIFWAESLFVNDQAISFDSIKGNRNDIENKYFCGVGDIFKIAGGKKHKYENLWWQAGRYVELQIRTDAEALTIDKIIFNETRYPLEPESKIRTSDNSLNQILPLMTRSLQMCIHETYMDCPYYEQLMYVGDTRLQVLATYVLTSDRRAPEKAIKLLEKSILENRLSQSRYPSRKQQIIPPFSLWWVAMVYDYAMWNDVSEHFQTGVRGILEAFRECKNTSNLILSPAGWNFCDWADGWKRGVSPGGNSGISALLNWQYVMTLKMASELESSLNNPDRAASYSAEANEMSHEIDKAFWDEGSGLYKDDESGKYFSEHTQALALLSGLVPVHKVPVILDNLCKKNNLTKTTIYFSYYLLEVFYKFDRMDELLNSLESWKILPAQGLMTTPERPEPSRSDCHGWGAHPIYHFYTSIAGIRPANFGGKDFYIRPQLGYLKKVEGTIQCLNGKIQFCFKQANGNFYAEINIPHQIKVVFEYNNKKYRLTSGNNKFLIARDQYQLESIGIDNYYTKEANG